MRGSYLFALLAVAAIMVIAMVPGESEGDNDLITIDSLDYDRIDRGLHISGTLSVDEDSVFFTFVDSDGKRVMADGFAPVVSGEYSRDVTVPESVDDGDYTLIVYISSSVRCEAQFTVVTLNATLSASETSVSVDTGSKVTVPLELEGAVYSELSVLIGTENIVSATVTEEGLEITGLNQGDCEITVYLTPDILTKISVKVTKAVIPVTEKNYTFTIRVTQDFDKVEYGKYSESDLRSGIRISAKSTDAASALVKACAANNIECDINNDPSSTYYGWIVSLFGLVQYQSPGEISLWTYWIQYHNGSYNEWTLGHYTDGGSFSLIWGTTTEDGDPVDPSEKPNQNTVVNPDGSTTTTITDTKNDEEGNTTETKTETTKDKDGNLTEVKTETTKDKDGNIIFSSETTKTSKTEKDEHGNETKTEEVIRKDNDGSSTETGTSITTDKDGNVTSKTETNTEKDKDGNITSSTETKTENSKDENGNDVSNEETTHTKGDGSSTQTKTETTVNKDGTGSTSNVTETSKDKDGNITSESTTSKETVRDDKGNVVSETERKEEKKDGVTTESETVTVTDGEGTKVTDGTKKVTTETSITEETSKVVEKQTDDGSETKAERTEVRKDALGNTLEETRTVSERTETADTITQVDSKETTRDGATEKEEKVLLEATDGSLSSEVTSTTDRDGNVNTESVTKIKVDGDQLTTEHAEAAVGNTEAAIGKLTTASEDVRKTVTVESKDTAVTVTPGALGTFSDYGAGLRIAGDGGSIRMDTDACGNLSGKDDDVSISMAHDPVDRLNEKQAQTVGGKKFIELSAKAGDHRIHELGGRAEITFRYEPSPTDDIGRLCVYYVDEDGNMSRVLSSSFDPETGMFTMETDHFSVFMVGLAEESDGGFPTAAVIGAVVIVIVAVAAVAVYHTRKS